MWLYLCILGFKLNQVNKWGRRFISMYLPYTIAVFVHNSQAKFINTNLPVGLKRQIEAYLFLCLFYLRAFALERPLDNKVWSAQTPAWCLKGSPCQTSVPKIELIVVCWAVIEDLDLDSVSSKVREDVALLEWMTIYGGGSVIESERMYNMYKVAGH